jgi:hypothetical protein
MRERQFADCKNCSNMFGHTERAGCIIATERAQAVNEGWYNMICFNGLSKDQQHFLVFEGYLPIGYRPEGRCTNGAEIEITTMHDLMPGPRFYCRDCAVEHLLGLDPEGEWLSYNDTSPALTRRR